LEARRAKLIAAGISVAIITVLKGVGFRRAILDTMMHLFQDKLLKLVGISLLKGFSGSIIVVSLGARKV
jgi:hypothetical protein